MKLTLQELELHALLYVRAEKGYELLAASHVRRALANLQPARGRTSPSIVAGSSPPWCQTPVQLEEHVSCRGGCSCLRASPEAMPDASEGHRGSHLEQLRRIE